MKKVVIASLLFIAMLGMVSGTHAGGYKFAYKLSPGQKWTAVQLNRNESEFMGKADVSQNINRMAYTVKKGPKTGWVQLIGRLLFKDETQGAGPMLKDARFYARMHTSGELRDIRAEVPAPAPMQNQSQMPPQMAAMYAQSGQMMAELHKPAVFWFPEFPEETLALGDEFEVIRKSRSGGPQALMAVQAVTKQIFVLDDVADGLAYFSVTEKTTSKMSGGPMGTGADTQTVGKGEAIFDLKLGMWIEITVKTKIRVQLGQGSGQHEALSVSKLTMELEN